MPVAFQEQIKTLIELQVVDSEIHDLKQQLAAVPAQQQKIDKDFEQKKAGLKAAEDQMRSQQLKQKDKEGQLASAEEKIKKLQSQLYQLKSNKEYQAMELEIKSLKADKSVLEEEILRFFDALDELRKGVAKEKELLAAEEKKSKAETDRLKSTSASLTARTLELEEARKKYLPLVDPRLLTQYEKILKSREGIALVPLASDGSCSGCNLELPPQTINEIQMGDKLITCESCARILYWKS